MAHFVTHILWHCSFYRYFYFALENWLSKLAIQISKIFLTKCLGARLATETFHPSTRKGRTIWPVQCACVDKRSLLYIIWCHFLFSLFIQLVTKLATRFVLVIILFSLVSYLNLTKWRMKGDAILFNYKFGIFQRALTLHQMTSMSIRTLLINVNSDCAYSGIFHCVTESLV